MSKVAKATNDLMTMDERVVMALERIGYSMERMAGSYAFNERIVMVLESMLPTLAELVDMADMTQEIVHRLDERAKTEDAGFATLQAALSKPSPAQPANGELGYQDRLIAAMKRERD